MNLSDIKADFFFFLKCKVMSLDVQIFRSEFALHFSKLIYYNKYAIPEKSIPAIDKLNEKSLVGPCTN